MMDREILQIVGDYIRHHPRSTTTSILYFPRWVIGPGHDNFTCSLIEDLIKSIIDETLNKVVQSDGMTPTNYRPYRSLGVGRNPEKGYIETSRKGNVFPERQG